MLLSCVYSAKLGALTGSYLRNLCLQGVRKDNVKYKKENIASSMALTNSVLTSYRQILEINSLNLSFVV